MNSIQLKTADYLFSRLDLADGILLEWLLDSLKPSMLYDTKDRNVSGPVRGPLLLPPDDPDLPETWGLVKEGRDLKAGAEAEYTADLEERLGTYERDNLPDRNDQTGRFEKRG